AVDILTAPGNALYFSAISAYEILLKNRLGKLDLPIELITDLPREVLNAGWIERPISLSASVMAARFPASHRDPFDRILAAQAIEAKIPVISIDSALDSFGVTRVWK
ncbi:MAG: type II toxin-antitoxin system VapC family toxin, partial [Verrucomicrobiales bacterium]